MLLGSSGAVVLTDSAIQARIAVALALLVTFAAHLLKIVWLARSERHELRGAAQLLMVRFGNRLFLRGSLPILGLVLALQPSRTAAIAAAVCMIGSEFLSRYLFFVSVVPSNIAAQYLPAEAA